jgi:8-oxo-dGTP pyrophosphatase MutT (NUDIX family)
MNPRSTRLSAGVVVVRQTGEGWRFLLLRAFNHWDFPKGMVEPGEQPLEAAVREVREESAIEDLEFAWGHGSTRTGPYSHGKVACYYIARTPTEAVALPVNPELGRPEHSEFRWVDFEEAMGLVTPRVRPVLRWAAQAMDLAGVRRASTDG